MQLMTIFLPLSVELNSNHILKIDSDPSRQLSIDDDGLEGKQKLGLVVSKSHL